MNRHYFKVMGIIVLLLTAVLSPTVATTYKLVKVTSVEADKMYVFEQSGSVMNNTINSKNALETTSCATTGLTGDETKNWNNILNIRIRARILHWMLIMQPLGLLPM